MTLGTILGASFQVMRRNPLPTFGLALLLTLLSSVVSIGLIALAFVPATASGLADDPSSLAGTIVLAVLGAVLGAIAQLVSLSIIQGVVTLDVASGTLGERMRLGGLWRRLRPRLPRTMGWVALALVASLVAVGLLVAIVAGFASVGGSGAGIAVGIGLLGSLGLAVLAAWLGTKTLFVTPAIVLERRGVVASIRRSWTLTRGYFWRTFGIMLLVLAILWLASLVVAFPVQIIATIALGLVGIGGDESTTLVVGIVVYALLLLVGLVINALGTVMVSAAIALLHLDTRMRREGLDQELVRAAEARAAGTGFPDPYVDPASVSAPGSPWL